jgi:hypothetical protein
VILFIDGKKNDKGKIQTYEYRRAGLAEDC